MQYAQTVFEGLKAYTTEDSRIVTFRPELNAQRLIDSARRLVIPEVPVEMFMDAVDKVVAANKGYVPPLWVRCDTLPPSVYIWKWPADRCRSCT